jgi:hypothetical protein
LAKTCVADSIRVHGSLSSGERRQPENIPPLEKFRYRAMKQVSFQYAPNIPRSPFGNFREMAVESESRRSGNPARQERFLRRRRVFGAPTPGKLARPCTNRAGLRTKANRHLSGTANKIGGTQTGELVPSSKWNPMKIMRPFPFLIKSGDNP